MQFRNRLVNTFGGTIYFAVDCTFSNLLAIYGYKTLQLNRNPQHSNYAMRMNLEFVFTFKGETFFVSCFKRTVSRLAKFFIIGLIFRKLHVNM